MAVGRADEAVGQTSAFATSVREATREMLVELGCAVGSWSDMVADRATRTERPRIRLPWSREGDSRGVCRRGLKPLARPPRLLPLMRDATVPLNAAPSVR